MRLSQVVLVLLNVSDVEADMIDVEADLIGRCEK